MFTSDSFFKIVRLNSISISKDSLVVLGASSKDSLQVVVSGVDICLKCNMSKRLRILYIYTSD